MGGKQNYEIERKKLQEIECVCVCEGEIKENGREIVSERERETETLRETGRQTHRQARTYTNEEMGGGRQKWRELKIGRGRLIDRREGDDKQADKSKESGGKGRKSLAHHYSGKI